MQSYVSRQDGGTEKSTRRSVGRPRDHLKVDAILASAWQLFLKRGVEAVSVEEIASRAGVSKGTIYSRFVDKSALFDAVMLHEMEKIEKAQNISTEIWDVSLEEKLRMFGLGIMTFLASDLAVDFYGPLSAEIRKHPELSYTFWELGPGRTHKNLQLILAAASQNGEIKIDNPADAADVLLGLWQGFTNLRLALDIGPNEVRKSIPSRVERGIAIFMAAFGNS